ncbi:hypothetical protein ACFFQF_11630 [Haladaptatus pallidirubidus]
MNGVLASAASESTEEQSSSGVNEGSSERPLTADEGRENHGA